MKQIYPCYEEVIKIIKEFKGIIFPEHFKCSDPNIEITKVKLKTQIEIAIKFSEEKLDANEITNYFFEHLDDIRELLINDANAGFEGDPAANSIDEIILAYPGMFAIFVYRLSNVLFNKQVPFIPRMMTEYAHSKTGIDIHPGATIGKNFFIDHGTGVVIGETTNIGNNVKIYQGVTLGALSTRGGQKLNKVKRHPTLQDNVTVYANATILGGNTVIGENSVIGGNAFIIDSIEANSKVMSNK